MKMDYIEKMVNRCGVILNIPKPNLELHKFDSDEISAIFILSTYTILVNTLWLDSANPIEIFITICHEMRHAYQFYRVNNDKVTNDNKGLIQKWKEEFDNYCYPQDERFLEQEIEIDAIAFAHFMTLKYFGERTVIPESIKEKVYLRIQQITKTLEG
jgi:hypothetical protein